MGSLSRTRSGARLQLGELEPVVLAVPAAGFVGLLSLGRRPDNRRIRPKVTGHSIDEVKAKLDALREDFNRGIELGNDYTLADACRDFLTHDMHHLAEGTADELRRIVRKWILPHLGHAKLRELKADEVDAWLDVMARELSSGSVKKRLSTLRRIIRFAEAHNHASRNVAALVDAPRGQLGRPSKALTLEQTLALLDTSQHRPVRGYIALSVFTGIRTEEARPLEWRHLHLKPVRGQICSCGKEHSQTAAPHVEIWRSVREGGDTKTPKSRWTIGLPTLAVDTHRASRAAAEMARRARMEVRRDRLRVRHSQGHRSGG